MIANETMKEAMCGLIAKNPSSTFMIAYSPSFAAPLPLGVYTFGAIEQEAVREWQWLFKLPPISIVDSSFAEYDSVSTGKVYALLCIATRMSNMHIIFSTLA